MRAANPAFQEVIDELPPLMEDLVRSPLRLRDALGHLPDKGVYVFYEAGQPIYVGRSNTLKTRILTHSRPSSGHGSATFAFNLAKREAVARHIDVESSKRGALERLPEFAALYQEAKRRVARMPVRVIEINDPVVQTIFEVYASVELGTGEFNDFDTH